MSGIGVIGGIVALVVIGLLLCFAAVLDRRRGRKIEHDLHDMHDLPEEADDPRLPRPPDDARHRAGPGGAGVEPHAPSKRGVPRGRTGGDR